MTSEGTQVLSREEMVEKLMWTSGGYGFGIGGVAASLFWAMERPGPDKPDMKSIVSVHEPAEQYTVEELQKLLDFSQKATAAYDERYKWRLGANIIIFDKPRYVEGRWMGKRLSWDSGEYFNSLDEAIACFDRDIT